MISVPNHRQPLSGNSRWLILISICCITACGAGTHVSSTPATTEITPIVVPEQPKEKPFDSITKKLEPVDIDNNPSQTIQQPSVFPAGSMINIAVILPFNLDLIPLDGYRDDTTKTLEGDPKNAIEFYIGCKLAKESFDNPNLTANVYFLDDKNDSISAFNVLKNKPFPNVQYIIGPMSQGSLRVVAEYGKVKHIPVISPFENSASVTKDNPYYFNATPTAKIQYGFLIDEITAAFPGKTLEIIYDETDSTLENIAFLKNILQQKSAYPNPTIATKYYKLEVTDDIAKAMTQTDTLSNRVVLIYSDQENYIKSVLAKLRPVKNKLSIYTSSVVRNNKNLTDLKYPHTLFIAYPYYSAELKTKDFAAWYEETYHKEPSEIMYQGYDVMNMVFDQISQNRSFSEVSQPKYYTNILQTRFRFIPALNKNGGIDYYDNNYVYLFKYFNGIFIKVKSN